MLVPAKKVPKKPTKNTDGPAQGEDEGEGEGEDAGVDTGRKRYALTQLSAPSHIPIKLI